MNSTLHSTIEVAGTVFAVSPVHHAPDHGIKQKVYLRVSDPKPDKPNHYRLWPIDLYTDRQDDERILSDRHLNQVRVARVKLAVNNFKDEATGEHRSFIHLILRQWM
jgi:hypothetical protein